MLKIIISVDEEVERMVPPMAGNMLVTARKLMAALNTRDYKLTMSNKQFMGREGRPHNYYCLNKSIWSEEKNKYIGKEIYATPSALRMTLFLRDMWYIENGWELPTDQELWNKVREELKERNNG